MELFDPGIVRLRAEFDLNDVATNPSEVQFKVRDPTGGIASYTYGGGQVTRPQTGRFEYNLSVPTPGRWWWKAIGTGAVEATAEGTFRVRDHMIP